MIRRLYDWTLSLAGHRRAEPALAAVSFVESSFFPIPPDVMLLPMVLARPHAAWRIAAICTVASVAGALLGYLIGWGFFEGIARPILDFYGKGDDFAEFAVRYNEWGAWAVLFAGITPFPFKVITIASGATGLSLPVFIISSIVARGLRFFLVAGLLRAFGPSIRDFIERQLGLVFTVFCVLLVGGFALVRYM